jgi:hypothetical protein
MCLTSTAYFFLLSFGLAAFLVGIMDSCNYDTKKASAPGEPEARQKLNLRFEK